MKNKAIPLLLIEDQGAERSAIDLIRKEVFDFELVGWARNAKEAYEFLEQQPVEIVILDLNFEAAQEQGVEIARTIRKRHPAVKILIWSRFLQEQNSDSVRVGKELLEIGVKGFVSKRNLVKELEKALVFIRAGELYFSKDLAYWNPNHPKHTLLQITPKPFVIRLTPRQQQALAYKYCQKLSRRQIAARMDISIEGVRTHLDGAYAKLPQEILAQKTTLPAFEYEQLKQQYFFDQGLISCEEV